MFKLQQRSKYTVKWLWWCLQKTMKWFLRTLRVKACVFFVPLAHKVKAQSASFSFAAGHVFLMLSGFVLFSVEVVCVGSWPVTLIFHPLFITLALSKCFICQEWTITVLLKRVLVSVPLTSVWCHSWVLWQSPDAPVMSCFHAWLSRLRALFCVEAWCSYPGTHILSFSFSVGVRTTHAPCSVLLCECAVSSLLGHALCPCVFCVVARSSCFIGCVNSRVATNDNFYFD